MRRFSLYRYLLQILFSEDCHDVPDLIGYGDVSPDVGFDKAFCLGFVKKPDQGVEVSVYVKEDDGGLVLF